MGSLLTKPKTKQKIAVGKKKTKIKKRAIFLIFVLLLIVMFSLLRFFLPELLFGIGKTTFEAKDYKTSSELFKNAYRLRPENRDYPYYWALSLSRMPMTYHSQKDLYSISQMDNYAKAEIYATKVLNFFKSKVIAKNGDNYIEDAVHNDQVLRWDVTSLPLKYYVDTAVQVPPYYLDLIKKSFLEWQSKTNGFLTFAPVANKEEAQIVFSFLDVDNSKLCTDGNCEYSVGNTIPLVENNKLKSMDVKINVKNNLQQYFSPDEISTVMVHEIGHALGIWGHSDGINDIMYYSADQNYGSQKEISRRDLNTLKLLYSLAPDVTNVELTSSQLAHFWYAPVILSGLDKSKDNDIAKSAQKLNENPSDVSSWLELAARYSSDKQYVKSIEALTRGLQFVRDPQTAAVVYFNMANDYLGLKEYSRALKFASMAQQINNDFDTRALIALIKSSNGDYIGAERDYLELRKEQPENIDVALNLTDLYKTQKKYLKVRDTIKSLVKSNPDSANDPKLAAYKLYVTF